jgi:FdhD protein
MADKFSISPTEIHRLQGQISRLEPDFVSVEEPLEIQLLIDGQATPKSISITMRTPGNDLALATGFLYTEGIIRNGSDIQSFHTNTDPNGNRICLEIDPNISLDLSKLERHFYTTSSCGVCGKASLDAVQQNCWVELPKTQWKVSPSTIYSLPDSLRAQQANFQQTGGIHGCALFDLQGKLIHSAEDVGRHNALDKLIGYFLLHTENGLPLSDKLNAGDPLNPVGELPEVPFSNNSIESSAICEVNADSKQSIAADRLARATLLEDNSELFSESELPKVPISNTHFTSSANCELNATLKKSTFQNVTFGEPEITTRTAATVPSIPLSEHILLLSGRISFELVQKAAMAGIRFIAAVGAPSSLAIDLAEDMGITLVGFLRGDKCNIYTHPHRININPT